MKYKHILLNYFTPEARNVIFGNAEPYLDMIQRDCNTLMEYVISGCEKRKIKLKETDYFDFLALGSEYLEYLQRNHVKHSEEVAFDYSQSLTEQERTALWLKYKLNEVSVQYFIPVCLQGFQTDKEYDRTIPFILQRRIRTVCCSALRIPYESIYVLGQLMTLDEIIKEKDYIRIVAEEFLEHGKTVTKHAYDTIKPQKSSMVFFIPIVEQVEIPSNRFTIQNYREYFFTPETLTDEVSHCLRLAMNSYIERHVKAKYPELTYSEKNPNIFPITITRILENYEDKI